VVEVIRRVVAHPDSLHHGPRADIGRDRERNDLLKADRLEAERERGAGRLRGVAMAPGMSSEPPADLHGRREMRLE
jgi:hypothetical protein